jgi:integrase
MTAWPAWEGTGLVWCQRNGRPIGNHTDWDEWMSLLTAAGTRDAQVHDARHTAATLLLAQGVDRRLVMQILGHFQISMTSKYAHVLPAGHDRCCRPDRPGALGHCHEANCTWRLTKIAR